LATMNSQGDATSQNVTSQIFAMLDDGRPIDTVEDGILADEEPACVALVPLVSSAQWSRPSQQPSRPDSTFLTHLIATAEQAPQTRTLRRASLADAQTAYGANPRGVQSAGIRTRQTI
ncbi:MAG: hypothetical protein JWQ07_5349, partial [Ramlibacter sp.]|nr:hypothetical protein [Ramlibacter sp.]